MLNLDTEGYFVMWFLHACFTLIFFYFLPFKKYIATTKNMPDEQANGIRNERT